MKNRGFSLTKFIKTNYPYIALALFLLPLIIYAFFDHSIHEPDNYSYYIRVLDCIKAAQFNLPAAIWRGLVTPDMQSPFTILLLTPVVYFIEKLGFSAALVNFVIIAFGFVCLIILYKIFYSFAKDKINAALLAMLCLSNLVFFYTNTRLYTEVFQLMFILGSLYSAILFLQNQTSLRYAIVSIAIILFSVSVKMPMPFYQLAPIGIIGYVLYKSRNFLNILRKLNGFDYSILLASIGYFVFWLIFLSQPQAIHSAGSYLYWLNYLSPKNEIHVLGVYTNNAFLYPDQVSWLGRVILQLGFFAKQYGIQYFILMAMLFSLSFWKRKLLFKGKPINIAIAAILLNSVILLFLISFSRCSDSRLSLTTFVLLFIILGLSMIQLLSKKVIMAVCLIFVLSYVGNLYYYITKVEPSIQKESIRTRHYVDKVFLTLDNFVTINYDNYFLLCQVKRSEFSDQLLGRLVPRKQYTWLPVYYALGKISPEEATGQLEKEMKDNSKKLLVYNWRIQPLLKNGFSSLENPTIIQEYLDDPKHGYSHDNRSEQAINFEGNPYFFVYKKI